MSNTTAKLHITHDDKFIDAFIKRTQELGFQNHIFYIYAASNETALKHVKDPSIKRITLNELNRGVINIKQYDTVYIHYFADDLVQFVQKYGAQSKFVWIFWGADAFDMPQLRESYLAPYTAQLVSKTINKRQSWRSHFSHIKQHYLQARASNQKKRAALQFKYFAHYIDVDNHLIRKRLTCNFQSINFTYGTISDFAIEQNEEIEKSSILIGNSANPANNHLDALLLLKSHNLDKIDSIICPLSYSGTPQYVKEIKDRGNELFGTKFKPIEGFLNRKEYNQLLSSVGYALMPHYRSQAFGNIISLLWQGTKVFFYTKNSLSKLLKNRGFYIFDIEDMDLTPLTEMQIKKNQALLQEFIGDEATKMNYINLLSV